MSVYFSCDGAELREVSGEMNSIIATGQFTISKKGAGPACVFQVGSHSWDLATGSTQGPYKVLDSRTTVFTTPDYMTTLYLSLPKSATAEALALYAHVLGCAAEGKDPAAPAPAAAAAAEKGPAEPPAPPANQVQAWGQFMGALGNAAQHMAGEVAKKMQEDTQTVMNALAGKPQGTAHPHNT